MNPAAVGAACCLLGVVVLLCRPAGLRRGGGRLTATLGAAVRRPAVTGQRWVGVPAAVRATAATRPWHWVAGAVGAAGLAAALLSGPVAASVAAVYSGLAVRGWSRRESAAIRRRAHARAVDGLCALAADLRAGLPPAGRLPAAHGRIGHLTTAAWRLAEATGAPVADLVERIEADARAADRARASAAAQAAGARATAWLLAALPLGGIALGYGIGADPLAVLLHTPIGAGCAAGALLLQLAGLAWADRLAGEPREALG